MREDKIRSLIELLRENEDLAEVEIAEAAFGFHRIRVRRREAGAAAPLPAARPAPETESRAPATAPAETELEPGLHAVKAPMVGTFYRSPNPGAESFVKEGSRVTPGTALCIIEAMKLMNEIESEFSGTVREILVPDGQPVEYGQPLFLIEED
jgi:acetyl-CoA carboxylase biotin carboxyl carrier protein